MVLKNLNSVGCVIDENGVTYPQYPDNEDGTFGGYDEDGAFHVDDIENDEWFDALSTEDWTTLQTIVPDSIYVKLDNPTEVEWLEMKAELAMGI